MAEWHPKRVRLLRHRLIRQRWFQLRGCVEAQLRLSKAERRLAELRAENASLRAQIVRGDEVAELIAMGARIAPKGRS